MYLLDTNICIYAMKGIYPTIGQKLLAIEPDKIFISSVTIGELEYGAAKSRWGTRTREVMCSFLANYEILPFRAIPCGTRHIRNTHRGIRCHDSCTGSCTKSDRCYT